MMEWTWADRNWSWVGLCLSATIMLLLFFTPVLRSDSSVSRWRDPAWLAWLAPAAYMIHQFEEYGISMQGVHFAFPDLLCAAMGMSPYPACGLPEALFIAINVPPIWLAGLACALLSRRNPLVGLAVYGIHFTNALAHLGVWATGPYNPGALSALLIQLPLSLWVFYACFGPGRMSRWGIAILVTAGSIASVILLGSVKLFALGKISGPLLILVQVLNPALAVLGIWLAEKALRRGASPLAEPGPSISQD